MYILGHGRHGGRVGQREASGKGAGRRPLIAHSIRARPALYGQTANEDPRKSEFESQRILNVEGGLS